MCHCQTGAKYVIHMVRTLQVTLLHLDWLWNCVFFLSIVLVFDTFLTVFCFTSVVQRFACARLHTQEHIYTYGVPMGKTLGVVYAYRKCDGLSEIVQKKISTYTVMHEKDRSNLNDGSDDQQLWLLVFYCTM